MILVRLVEQVLDSEHEAMVPAAAHSGAHVPRPPSGRATFGNACVSFVLGREPVLPERPADVRLHEAAPALFELPVVAERGQAE